MKPSLESPTETLSLVASHSSPDYSIQVLQRGMLILDALLEARAPLNLEQICSRTGLVKSTAYRIITNLIQGAYLTQTPEGFWLGLKLLQMGTLVEERFDLKQIAAPYLNTLCEQLNETVHLAVMDHDLRVVYVVKVVPPKVIGIMMSRVGITAPMYCTGLGKAMAAFYPETQVKEWLEEHRLRAYTARTITTSEALLTELKAVHDRGYAIDDREHEEHVRCVAAPVYNRAGEVVAAVSVAGPEMRVPLKLEGSPFLQAVLATARKISNALGYNPDMMR